VRLSLGLLRLATESAATIHLKATLKAELLNVPACGDLVVWDEQDHPHDMNGSSLHSTNM